MAKILIVDDSADLREVLTEVFVHAGFEAIVASDGLEALRLARRHLPNVGLTDMDMPGMTGEELCHALHEHPALEIVPVAVLSGTLLPGDTCCQRAGAGAVLLEPMSNQELVSTVYRLMGRKPG